MDLPFILRHTSQVALLQVERSLRRAREARIPLLGLVLNMDSQHCPECDRPLPLFGESGAEDGQVVRVPAHPTPDHGRLDDLAAG